MQGGLKTSTHTSILKLENVADAPSLAFMPKRVAYIHTAKNKNTREPDTAAFGGKMPATRYQWIMMGKIRSNLPPKAMGGRVRVMLYPSNI